MDEWIHRFHVGTVSCTGVGQMRVRRSRRWVGAVLDGLLRLPAEGDSVATRVTIIRPVRDGDRGTIVERWHRDFGMQRLTTTIHRHGTQASERVGIMELCLSVRTGPGQVWVSTERTALRWGRYRAGIPRWLSPTTTAHAWVRPTAAADRFHIRVRVRVPLIGTLLTYHGEIREELCR